jgi:hypothetical protein
MERSMRAAWLGLFGALLLVASAMALPPILGWAVHAKSGLPPLDAVWDPRLGPGTAPALLIAGVGGLIAVDVAARMPWSRLLGASYGVGLAWMLSLAFVDGSHGVSHVLGSTNEYLRTARETTDLPHTLHTYVDRIPYDAPLGNWPVHVAGHPAGALTFFVALDRLGLGSGFAAGMVVTLIAASTAVAVLVTVRILGAETLGRRAAPFLVLVPAAIWQCVSADAMFAAVAAWGIAALAMAATRGGWRGHAWAVLAGLLLGSCVMLSYGLPLLAILAATILLITRCWRPLIPAAVAALAVVLVFAAFGFEWWHAIGALHERYWAGIAKHRPAAYWNWANLAALSCSAGLLLGAALAHTATGLRDRLRDPTSRVVVLLAGAGVAMALVADATQYSRGEVERIWLPFIPWMLLCTAFLPERWRRRGLVLQLILALLLQHLLLTTW